MPRLRRLAAALVATAAALVLGAPPAAAERLPLNHRYVALGDSFASSPLTGLPVGEPVGCARTQNNYPRQVAAVLRVRNFTDASCGGATTHELFRPQWVTGGTNPAQLSALTRDTTLVTLGIGGNDLGLMGWYQRCTRLELTRYDCFDKYSPGDDDVLVQRIARLGPVLERVMREIRVRAPQARILVIGYPVVAPVTGTGCFPNLPLEDSDVAYLRDIQQRLNLMLEWVALLSRAGYVDTYTSSAGHGPCEIDGVRWIEGLVPGAPAASLHPNAMGQSAMADEVLAALGRYRA